MTAAASDSDRPPFESLRAYLDAPYLEAAVIARALSRPGRPCRVQKITRWLKSSGLGFQPGGPGAAVITTWEDLMRAPRFYDMVRRGMEADENNECAWCGRPAECPRCGHDMAGG